MPIDFDKQEYWHHRFATETQFEWLVPSSTFMSIIEPHVTALLSNYHHSHNNNTNNSDAHSESDESDASSSPPAPRVLQIGFGTSDLQNHLRARGLRHILNIDYEPLAIERGRQLEEQAFGDVVMKYAVMDATQLCFSEPTYDDDGRHRRHRTSQKFDLVLDKSTVDAVSCGGQEAFLRMARGVRRCLAPGRVWISLSYSSSRFDVREEGLLPFEVDVLAKIPTPKIRATDPDIYHWCYLLTPKDEKNEE